MIRRPPYITRCHYAGCTSEREFQSDLEPEVIDEFMKQLGWFCLDGRRYCLDHNVERLNRMQETSRGRAHELLSKVEALEGRRESDKATISALKKKIRALMRSPKKIVRYIEIEEK